MGDGGLWCSVVVVAFVAVIALGFSIATYFGEGQRRFQGGDKSLISESFKNALRESVDRCNKKSKTLEDELHGLKSSLKEMQRNHRQALENIAKQLRDINDRSEGFALESQRNLSAARDESIRLNAEMRDVVNNVQKTVDEREGDISDLQQQFSSITDSLPAFHEMKTLLENDNEMRKSVASLQSRIDKEEAKVLETVVGVNILSVVLCLLIGLFIKVCCCKERKQGLPF